MKLPGMRGYSSLLVFVCFAAFSSVSEVHGAIAVYEPWDLGIGNGASAVGLSGTSSFGFSGSGWEVTNGTASGTFDAVGLAYFDDEGNELIQSPGAVSVTPSDGNPRWGRSLTEPLTNRPDEYYVSYLLRLDSSQAGDAFWTSDGSWDKGGFGLQSSPAIKFINGQSSGATATQGQTNLLVARLSRDGSTGVQDFGELWVNPILTNPGSPDATFSTGGVANNRIRDATSALFKFNTVNSGTYTIDEFRIGDSFADVVPFIGVPSLSLEVDTTYGAISLVNDSDTSYQLASYEITSNLGGIDAAGFLPLQLQDRPDFPAGSGVGNGWEVVGTPDSNFLAEQFLLGDSTLGPGERLTLGPAYNVSLGHRDLSVKLLLEDGTVLPVTSVTYVDSTTSAPGDYNDDQTVNLADYTIWRDTLGTLVAVDGSGADGNADGVVNAADYTIWKLYFGASSASPLATSAGASVPEPSGVALMLFGIMAAGLPRAGRGKASTRTRC